MKAQFNKIFLLTGAALLLGGCSGLSHNSQSVGNLKSSSSVYVPSNNLAKVQTKVVKEYIPIPVPGQLMPVPKKSDHSVAFKTKEAAVSAANKQALVTPVSGDFFNAMMTYNFMPGSLYVIYTAPMHITDIVLQPGEKVISEAAGDTLRWQIVQTYSGQGADVRQHILVKPNSPGLVNTVIITTNQRTYHLVLRSTKNNTYMVSVKWNYPKNMVNFSQNQSQSMPSEAANSAGMYKLDLAKLDFNYKFGMSEGSKPSWYPVRVFNDGRQTFIEFSKNFYAANLPVLYVSDNGGKYATAINWRLKGRYMIIDTVVQKARLQTGVDTTGKTIVQIEQTG